MATPFTDGGALDRDGLPRLVERALETGITGFTVLGIAGEAHRLTDDERRQVVETVVKEVRGRVPVAVGALGLRHPSRGALARMAQDSGAQALMLAPAHRLAEPRRGARLLPRGGRRHARCPSCCRTSR